MKLPLETPASLITRSMERLSVPRASCSEDLEPRRAAVCPAPHDVLFVVLVGNVFSGVVFNLTHFLASPVVICKGRLRLHSLNQLGLTLLVKDPMGVLLSLLPS
ncbi:hypothetical protein HMPREF3036_02155 [Sutterella sp. KLE1602]|nr:hypothetical protein HMPREF3036_02155 [Sutterella sp. KLE1602]